jgi:Voltage-dependent anion channel
VTRPFGATMVMASGIVSIDLDAGGWSAASLVPLVCGAVVWVLALARGELWRGPAGVAATAVLGTRLVVAGWSGAGWALAGAAIALWAWVVLRAAAPLRAPVAPPAAPRRARVVARPAVRLARSGAAFLPAVATQSLAVLVASLGATVPGVVLFVVGLALYVRACTAFDLAEILRGRGDHWIAGGALAISALACAQLGSGAGWRDATVLLWLGAMAWLPALVAGELARPRLVGAPERWSTVFPLGMYAAMTFAVGALAGTGWMRAFARGWTWVAVAAWAGILLTVVPGLRTRLCTIRRPWQRT